MKQERVHALEMLLDCSLNMLRQAEAEEWLDVIETGTERERLIERFFEPSVEAEESDDVARVLRKMLQINEAIEDLAARSRGDLRENIGSIQQGRRAVSAYSENNGMDGRAYVNRGQ